VKFRPTKSGARRAVLSARVKHRRRRFGRATSCWAAIEAATVISPIRQPVAFSSAVIRGEP
jgi:hypothetical protein